MRANEQLAEWVKGNPIHSPDHPAGIDGGECCPDFSCCNPGLLAPEEERLAFLAADDRGRHAMLGTFLGRLAARECQGDRVHIADGGEGGGA